MEIGKLYKMKPYDMIVDACRQYGVSRDLIEQYAGKEVTISGIDICNNNFRIEGCNSWVWPMEVIYFYGNPKKSEEVLKSWK